MRTCSSPSCPSLTLKLQQRAARRLHKGHRVSACMSNIKAIRAATQLRLHRRQNTAGAARFAAAQPGSGIHVLPLSKQSLPRIQFGMQD